MTSRLRDQSAAHCNAGDTHPIFVAQHLLLNNVDQQMLSENCLYAMREGLHARRHFLKFILLFSSVICVEIGVNVSYVTDIISEFHSFRIFNLLCQKVTI